MTRTAAGIYDVVFTTPMPIANYAVTGVAINSGTLINVTNQTANGFTAGCFAPQIEPAGYVDSDFSVAVFATDGNAGGFWARSNNGVLTPANPGDTIVGSTSTLSTQTADFATNPASSFTFTNVPPWAKKITLIFNRVSHNSGSSQTFRFKVGTASGIIDAGYDANCINQSGSSNKYATDSFTVANSVGSASRLNGLFTLVKLDDATYSGSGNCMQNDTSQRHSAGTVDGLTEPITQIYFEVGGGNITAGKLRLLYE